MDNDVKIFIPGQNGKIGINARYIKRYKIGRTAHGDPILEVTIEEDGKDATYSIHKEEAQLGIDLLSDLTA